MTETVTAESRAPQPASPPTERVVAIAHLLGSQPGRAFTLTEITRELGISRATGHSILSTLADHQWVVRDATACYSLGPGIASLVRPSDDRTYHGILRELAECTATQVFLARRDVNTIVVVDSAGESATGVRVERGLRLPLVAPFGRDYVAWSSTSAQQTWLKGIGRPSAAFSRRISAVLAEIRDRGYTIERLSREYLRVYTALRALGGHDEPDAITTHLARAFADLTVIDVLHDELCEGDIHSIATISAPVFDEDGVVTMSVTAAPFNEVTAVETAQLGDDVKAAAARIQSHIATSAVKWTGASRHNQ